MPGRSPTGQCRPIRQDAGVRNAGWVVVLPIKELGAAKSRLRGALTGVDHRNLVLAMAQDTVAAVVGCTEVHGAVVVSDDRSVRAALTELGAMCVPDVPGAGINAALDYGAGFAAGSAVAALTADLPTLVAEELGAALAAAAGIGRRCYVPDAPGSGTVLLAAPMGTELAPRFGPGSAAAHAQSGAVRLPGEWRRLRRDVDTVADLESAVALGLGPRTAAVVGAALL
jgi:2-phospho-L-lactate/phosphoenolpyruvate guanylyltransferase